MNILIIGSGAREHAIAKCINRSAHLVQLFCFASSNNPGIEELSTDYYSGDICNVQKVCEYAQLWSIQCAIIGPEAPLAAGLADALWDLDIPVIGPKKILAQLESSKAFTRHLMAKHQIPGLPQFKEFSSLVGAEDFLKQLGDGNYVIKANGLMAGKGVKVAGDHLHSFTDALAYCSEILQQQGFVIEEKLIGQEFSFMCFTDGKTLAPMPLVQDNKRAFEGDRGPNTGGMGSFSAADHRLPFLNETDYQQALHINHLILNALNEETKEPYIGIIYGGFIATKTGVYVIEYNARFGDPEALNVLSLLETDFIDLCFSLVSGTLNAEQVRFANQATVCKYAVPEGYPDHPVRHAELSIAEVTDNKNLYLAAVHGEAGKLYATGSRTVAYVGIADTLSAAEAIAEREISAVKGQLVHRKDIGTAQLINQRIEAMRKLRDS